MYCEANDLILLPTLSLDPVSEQIHSRSNTSAIQGLTSEVNSLPSQLTETMAAPVKQCFSSLEALVNSLSLQLG